MSKGKPRIYRKDSLFDTYVSGNVPFLAATVEGGSITNAERLGLIPDKLNLLQHILKQWRSGDPDHPGFYDLKIMPENKRATVIIANSNKCKAEFIKLFQPMLNIIAGSDNITLDDYKRFNIAIPKGFKSHITEEIKDKTNIDARFIGSGKIEILLHTNNAKKPGIGPNADAYEIALCIVDPTIATEIENAGQLKKSAPATYNDCIYHIIRKQAKVIYTYDPKYSGLKIYIYARNYLTDHPDLAGPWSILYSTTIL